MLEVQTWTANVDGKRDRWSLVTWLLDVCGHTYSETNVDLKIPNILEIACVQITEKNFVPNSSHWKRNPWLHEGLWGMLQETNA